MTDAARRDLADIALAGRVFSQHYAVPMATTIAVATPVRAAPQDDALAFMTLKAGEVFHVLDLARDWAWGRGMAYGSVGYVDSRALVLP